MRSDLYQAFWLWHSLAIDVDVSQRTICQQPHIDGLFQDGFRIYKFTKEASDLGLPERVPDHSQPHKDSFDYFREHFRFGLSVYVAGGDIRRDINLGVLDDTTFMDTVGVSEDDPPDEENYKRHEDEWKTIMGTELLSTMWPLETLPDIVLREVLDCDIADSLSGLSLDQDACN